MSHTSYFANSYGFIIEGGNFASVYGNQIINNIQRIYHGSGKKDRTEYDDFNHVISGDILRTKDFGIYQYPRGLDCGDQHRSGCEKGLLRANRTICAAEVIGVQGKVFTVVSYSGPDAQEEFERDFRKYSRLLTAGSFQVYGVNTDVPLVLFHNELRPLASFVGSLSFWGRFYLASWTAHLGVPWYDEVWLDSSKGILCRGPLGPECMINVLPFEYEDIPSDYQLLRDDICLRFLASLKLKDVDRAVVRAISNGNVTERKVEGHKFRQTTVFSTSTNMTVAVGLVAWGRSRFVPSDRCVMLEDKVVMTNGQSRFTLGHEIGSRPGFNLDTDVVRDELDVWLSQAPSVFYAHGISLDSILSDYKLITPRLYLRGFLSDCQEAHQRRSKQPVYLFVHPPGSCSTPTESCTTSSYHYWSFHPAGRLPLSRETCELLGLPVQLSLTVYPSVVVSCDNTRYRLIHEYQIARGFDPSTSDFAPSLGYPIYQIQHDSRVSEGFADATAASSTSLPAEPAVLPVAFRPRIWDLSQYQPNTHILSLKDDLPTLSNGLPLHAASTPAASYSTSVFSRASASADYDSSFGGSSYGGDDGSTFPTACNGGNFNLPSSSLPYGQSLSMPPVSSLPPGAYTLPSFSNLNVSGELQGSTDVFTSSPKRKDRDISDLKNAVERDAKRTGVFGPGQSDATSRSWPAQEVRLGDEVAGSAREKQPYESSEGMGGPVVQTSRLGDENRWHRLREEVERLRRMAASSVSGSGSVVC